MMRSVFACVVTLATLSLAAPGCTQPTSSPKGATATSSTAGSSKQPLGVFTATVDKKARTMTFQPVTPVAVAADGLRPESQSSINLSQSGGGTCGTSGQPCNSVDLVSTNCNDTYVAGKTGGTFSCLVELRSYYTAQSLPNVYAQITSITFGGSPITGYEANNSDSDATYTPPLSSTDGLWEYSNGSSLGSFVSPNDGSNGGNGSGLNTGSRTWEFNNPGDVNIVYTIAIWASLAYSSYQQTFFTGAEQYTAICPNAGGTGTAITPKAAETKVPLPFDFTIYQNNYNSGSISTPQEINIAQNGQLTFGTTTLDASGTAVPLPSTAKNVPRPAFFAFWDNITVNTKNTGVQICYQTIGTAPSRLFGVEWYNLDFAAAPDGPNKGALLDFEAFLYEGTGQIDTIYNTMTEATGEGDGRADGTESTTGLQDATGTVAESDYQATEFSYAQGNSYSYIPSP